MKRDPFKFDVEDITEIKPKYDFKEVGEGKFEVFVDNEMAFTVRFGAFMDYQLNVDKDENDGELFMFLMNNYSDKTVSHAIYDLYDIGFPVDTWLINYIDHLANHSTKYNAMLRMLSMLKNFGEDNADDYDSGSLDY
jgi:hypothetical protein